MRKPHLLPVTGSKPFGDFIVAVQLLRKQYPTLKFTDGWCFGDPADINTTNGIDTLVGGGDSNYHHTENMTVNTPIKLTASGFRVNDDWQFVWVLPTTAPKNIENLGDLADHQKKLNRFEMLADCAISDLGPEKSGFGDMPRYFERKGDKIKMYTFCHAEDAQAEPKLLKANHPVLIRPDGSLHIPELPDSLGYSNGENLFTLMSPLTPIPAKTPRKTAVPKPKHFDPFNL
jgi:hypothetical protein